jgi:large subunit ribosomal protein L14
MIQLLTKVNIIDNSGGYIGRCIKIIKPHGRDYAKIGDIILVTIKDTIKLPYSGPQSGMSKSSKITKGSLYKALVVRTKIHNDKRIATFDDNAVILLKTDVTPTPLGTRIKGPISNKLVEYQKILSQSKLHY